MPKPGNHIWTRAETNLLIRLRRKFFWDYHRIGIRLKLKAEQCENKYNSLVQRSKAENCVRPESKTCPNKVLIDRMNRDSARACQNITGFIFGDPPPGYSALDKRRA